MKQQTYHWTDEYVPGTKACQYLYHGQYVTLDSGITKKVTKTAGTTVYLRILGSHTSEPYAIDYLLRHITSDGLPLV